MIVVVSLCPRCVVCGHPAGCWEVDCYPHEGLLHIPVPQWTKVYHTTLTPNRTNMRRVRPLPPPAPLHPLR